MRVGALPPAFRLDGVLDEAAWTTAPAIANLTMSEPTAGGMPTGRTVIKVLAGPHAILIGIVCDDPRPGAIVSFTKQRDGSLANEDYVRFVFDTFLDGRSGYVFQVNPSGARYDAIINPGGADENAAWDGVWDAATHRDASGWSAEIWIPIQTLSFTPGLTRWHFNVERRIQRLQEVDRWASARPDWPLTLTSRAGLLVDLPAFDDGLGLTVRPAITTGAGIPGPDAPAAATAHPSLDVIQRVGSNAAAAISANTDFAETEVDTRQTNLTRFPLFFPEKRAFFLEDADIFQFGLGLGSDVVPFFSRRIGLVNGQEVPIRVAAKFSGRVGDTDLAMVAADTQGVDGVAPAATVGALRVRQKIWQESSVGVIATFGDPTGQTPSWLVGSDFTYQTSRFHGDKNFRVGLSGLVTDEPAVTGDHTAAAFRIEYPNDLWNLWLGTRRTGDGFAPSLGFVPRPGIYAYDGGIDYSPRFHNGWLRQWFGQVEPTLVTDLHGEWQSYEVFLAPINWRFESGDRFEFDVVPEGEQPTQVFDLEGVSIPAAPYHWLRYVLEAGSAVKRTLSVQAHWRFGGFYGGSLDQYAIVGSWHPSGLVGVDYSVERDVGHLVQGRFRSTLTGVTVNLNVSSDVFLSSLWQYDTQSQLLGTNTRFRWSLTPVADVFVIYNHNIRNLEGRWQLDSNQLLVKLQYAVRR